RALGPERIVVVTDALAAAGLPEATFTFGGQTAQVVGGVAKLMDGTITGSVLTMDQALRNVLALPGVSLSAASTMLSRNPARAAHAAGRKGLLVPGHDADLVLLDAALRPCATYCAGTLVYTADAWAERLAPASTDASIPPTTTPVSDTVSPPVASGDPTLPAGAPVPARAPRKAPHQ
ncbi:MAG TPA: hypothetical protein VF116_01095, partial [Ktedonobacterales bacterium]